MESADADASRVRRRRGSQPLSVSIRTTAAIEEAVAGINFFQPNPGPDQPCPICGSPRPSSERYPDHVCADCVARAADETGRPLEFFNLTLTGGFGAAWADTAERRDSDVCFIDGVRCRAAEAHFGGIVVRPEKGAL